MKRHVCKVKESRQFPEGIIRDKERSLCIQHRQIFTDVGKGKTSTSLIM